jgi:hypothetical protein
MHRTTTNINQTTQITTNVNNNQYNPEDDASTSVAGFWSLVFGLISQETWFDSWQRWKIVFIFNPPSPALELIRLHIH